MGKAADQVSKVEPAPEKVQPTESASTVMDADAPTMQASPDETLTTSETDLPAFVPDLSEPDDIHATREHIRQTRDEMSETIDAIKAKLAPQHLVEEAKTEAKAKVVRAAHKKIDQAETALHNAVDATRQVAGRAVEMTKQMALDPAETTKRTGAAISDTVRKRPVLAALVGLVIGGFFITRVRRRRAMACIQIGRE